MELRGKNEKKEDFLIRMGVAPAKKKAKAKEEKKEVKPTKED